jgi:hypothetical protein
MVIQHLGKKSIQTHRDIADVLRHIIKNVSERLFRNIQSRDPVTQWDFFCFFQNRENQAFISFGDPLFLHEIS